MSTTNLGRRRGKWKRGAEKKTRREKITETGGRKSAENENSIKIISKVDSKHKNKFKNKKQGEMEHK